MPDCVGVSLSWLIDEFWPAVKRHPALREKDPLSVTSLDIVRTIIRESTADRYIDEIALQGVSAKCLGPPTAFVTHAWSSSFFHLLRTLQEEYAPGVPIDTKENTAKRPETFIWLDFLGLKVKEDEFKIVDDLIQDIASALQASEAAVLYVDEHCDSLRNVWCLYEVWQGYQASSVASRPSGPGLHRADSECMVGRKSRLKVLVRDANERLHEVAEMACHIDSSSASASRAEVVPVLRDTIQSTMPLDVFDRAVRNAIWSALESRIEAESRHTDPLRQAHALYAHGFIRENRGDYFEAEKALRKALATMEAAQLDFAEPDGGAPARGGAPFDVVMSPMRMSLAGANGKRSEPGETQPRLSLPPTMGGCDAPLKACASERALSQSLSQNRALSQSPALLDCFDSYFDRPAQSFQAFQCRVLFSLALALFQLSEGVTVTTQRADLCIGNRFRRTSTKADLRAYGRSRAVSENDRTVLSQSLRQMHEQVKEALRLLARCLRVTVALHGGESGHAATVLEAQGQCHHRMANLKEAVELQERALEIRLAIAESDDDLAVAHSHFNLARVYDEMQVADKALDHGRQAVRIYERLLGSEHSIVTQARTHYGRSLRAAGDTEGALHEFHAVQTIYENLHGADALSLATVHEDIASCLRAVDAEAALESLMQCLRIRAAGLHRFHPLLLEAMDRVVACLQSLGRDDEADALQQQWGDAQPADGAATPQF